MRIHVINLDRSVDRLHEFRRANSHLPAIERFPAVDGTGLDRQALVESLMISSDLRYTDGALGCALSHIYFWEMAVRDATAITVCEDDSIFHHRFVDRAEALLNSLSSNWDLVMWGWNFDSILMFDMMPGISPCLATFDQETLRLATDEFQRRDVSPQAFRLWRSFGTVCYTVSPSGAQRLLHDALPLRPLTVDFPMINPAFANNGIDIVMNSLYPEMNAYVSFPPLVVTRNEHPISTVLPVADTI